MKKKQYKLKSKILISNNKRFNIYFDNLIINNQGRSHKITLTELPKNEVEYIISGEEQYDLATTDLDKQVQGRLYTVDG